MEQQLVEIGFTRFKFGQQNHNRDHAKHDNERAKQVKPETFYQIALIKINQRFGNAATRTRKSRQHLKRTKGLRRVELVVGVVEHQKKRDQQR